MSKQDTIFSCSKCDAQFSKWQGRCPECGAWGTIAEAQAAASAGTQKKVNKFPDTAEVVNFSEVKGQNVERIKIGLEEVDRVLGGGIVPGSLILLGGEPGIGKSTLVLQMAEKIAGKRANDCLPAKSHIKERDSSTAQTSFGEDVCSGRNDRKTVVRNVMNNIGANDKSNIRQNGRNNIERDDRTDHKDVLYVSGEESAEQIKLRMDRMGINPQDIHFLGETNTEIICGAILKYRPSLVIIDSIQMLYSDDVDSEPGSVNQIRASAAKLMGVAKSHTPLTPLERGTDTPSLPAGRQVKKGPAPAIIIIGHITKDGAVAGPKTLEHLVDTVLYLEGERYHSYRLLRTVKNRFGSTNEVGVFEMQSKGLQEIKNPSSLFMEEHQENLPGTIVTCVMEGTRPFLVEIQALTAPTTFGYPQRKVSGYDLNRLQLLLAVLQKRLGLNFSNKDVYLNVVGGFKIQEPSADLAICLALISALKNQPLQAGTAAFGEVGLGGEIRSVSQTEKRINEASKLGFKNIICPKTKKTGKTGNLEIGKLEEGLGLFAFAEIEENN